MSKAIENHFQVEAGDHFRFTNELTLKIPALHRPTLAQLRAEYPGIREIERDTSPTSRITLTLCTVLQPHEKLISGVECESRLEPHRKALLGYQHRTWLLKRQKKFPELIALLGKVQINFSGLVVEFDNDPQFENYIQIYPCAFQSGAPRWTPHWGCIGDVCGRTARIATSGPPAGEAGK